MTTRGITDVLKPILTSTALVLLLGSTTGSALAHGSWAFDDPFWKLHLGRGSEIGAPARFAAGPRQTQSDAAGESRAAGAGFATEIEAERTRLNREGFLQYNR